MENNTIEMSLLDPEEREQLNAIWALIPEEDRQSMSMDDVLCVMDLEDDYLEYIGLAQYNEKTEEMEYLEGDVDETEQMNYILEQLHKQGKSLTGVQVQLVQDAEIQYGIQQGWYDEED